MSKKSILEICCYSSASVAIAASEGAERAELCAGRPEGGTTPSYGCIIESKKIPGIQCYPIIRPRGGDFCYSDAEFREMLHDIQFCRDQGMSGVVFGILKPNGHFDVERMKQLKDAAGNMDITVHRAFDMSSDLFVAMEELIGIGIKRILTSGGYATAMEGHEILRRLVERSEGRISIMAGSGVNSENISRLHALGIREFHSSASQFIPSTMHSINRKISMNKEEKSDEYRLQTVNPSEIRAMKRILDSLTNNTI